ncbi:hypothetical protein OGAPHI_005920 [Ogataea philodendri]|uniref:Protein farnesyltransferase subunit beta n=1 Tax=Ogataea philodendri TaxID=1378263 RepID=A0A9P8NY70_9ASCO|nr:uncharacterized protein OGAPHI_005920 [Ogataea philodendri]KAH3661742.1 hypothetical protein OGAPHI_005920 [Ogataea philodendri]
MGQHTANFEALSSVAELNDRIDTLRLQESVSQTVESQMEVEMEVLKLYEEVLKAGPEGYPALNRKRTSKYVETFLTRPLPPPFVQLEASQTWVVYWLVNSKVLLGGEVSEELREAVGQKILECVDPRSGALGGGSGQIAHMASTYAGLLALAAAESYKALEHLDRTRIYHWLLSMKQPDGSFIMHNNGEADTRAVYCALCIAQLLNIMDEKLVENTAEWIASCQTYEGGFSGAPGDEAHGGYTFCAVAALSILDSPESLGSVIDLDNLVSWTVQRQYGIEGGLSGRTNKLVDGCYSHWVGGLSPFLEVATGRKEVLDRTHLQNYILCCCQDDPAGLRDKPGTRADFYHTNYVLCGLSMTQHYQNYKDGKFVADQIASTSSLVEPIDPIYGVRSDLALKLAQLYR